MGCDIHMYVQYREKTRDNGFWWNFGGEFNPGRNYAMFGILAGVRYDSDKGYESRGLHDIQLSYGIESDLYLYIIEEGQGRDGEPNTCTLEQAERWAKWGNPIINGKDGKPYKVRHPDWHSHSWLTPKELARAYRWYRKESEFPVPLEWRVFLNMAKALEDGGKNEVKIVFWFDN